MLTADSVTPVVRGPLLVVKPLSRKKRGRALEMAEHILGVGKTHEGRRRLEVTEALDAFDFSSRELKLFRGLKKLYDDACTYEPEADVDAASFRSDVFTAAHRHRQEVDRWGEDSARHVLGEVGAPLGLDVATSREALYADLKENWRLVDSGALEPDQLVQRYDDGQVQGVLLRAERIVVEVEPESPDAMRKLLRAMKFRELLFFAERNDDDSWRLTIDGPLSLFRSQTMYGLRLALLYPALCRTGGFVLTAEVRWGKGRRRKTLEVEQKRGRGELEDDRPGPAQTLAEGLVAAGLSAVVSHDLVETADGAVLVPDVRVTGEGGEVVLIERLGFWSRAAVVQRVEMAEAGLDEKMLFLVPKKLRVSEKMLDEKATGGGLLVFAKEPDAKVVAKRVRAMISGG